MNQRIDLSQHGILVQKNFALFWGGVFSNWYKSKFIIDNIEYNCVEQYMMAKKAKTFSDEKSYEAIMKTNDPAQQKAIGRSVNNYNDVIWSEINYGIVVDGLFAKFDQNLKQRQILLDTEQLILVEASPYDTRWGIGLAANNVNATNPAKWKGQNLLGYALMDVRSTINLMFEDD